MPFVLQFRLIPARASRAASAGYLPGSDTGAWLEEMARHAGAKFFVMPSSPAELEAGGLLILPDKAEAAPEFGPRVLRCALEHGRVAVPLSTELDPQVTQAEAAKLLPCEFYFFHPAMGLVGFDALDAITPASLILPPLPETTSWLHAAPGPPPPPPLARVSLALPESLDELFGDAASQIGSEDLKDIDKKSGLSDKAMNKLGKGLAPLGINLLGGLSSAIRWLKKMAPQGGGKKGNGARKGADSGAGAGSEGGGGGAGSKGIPMLDKFLQWTQDQMEKLQRLRESEIKRLLRLLETDPEEGLRYALPLGSGGDAGRGVAPPSGRLSLRNPTFGAGRGSHRVDSWDLPSNTQWELQQRYRKLATLEMTEGRFDRAAYIFAELLGDWHAAAGALVRGKRHQEAARIYLDRLGNRALAAKCLEEGGLLGDALPLYAELQEHEKCGDLFRQLGCEKEAVAAYQEAIRGSKGGRIHDARILFDKLKQPDLAVAVLASGWPHSSEARPCLEKHFEYLQQLGAHDEARKVAASLDDPARQLKPDVAMVEALKTIRQGQTDARVLEELSTVAITVIGEAVARGETQDTALLRMLPAFAPSDVLLKRDADRHEEQRALALRKQWRLKWRGEKVAPGSMVLRGSFMLKPQSGTQWEQLLSRGSTWLAVGWRSAPRDVWVMGDGATLLGEMGSTFDWSTSLPLPPIIFGADTTWLPFARKGEMPRYGLVLKSEFKHFPGQCETLLQRLAWLPAGLMAARPTAAGVWVLHPSASDTLDLSFYSYDGRLIRTHALAWRPPELQGPVRMVAHEENVFISIGYIFLHVRHGEILYSHEFMAGPITELHATRASQPVAVLVVAGPEVVLFDFVGEVSTVQLFSGGETLMPTACFLADGRIVVGDGQGALIYSAHPDTKLLAKLALPRDNMPSRAHFAEWGNNGLGVLWRDGLIQYFE